MTAPAKPAPPKSCEEAAERIFAPILRALHALNSEAPVIKDAIASAKTAQHVMAVQCMSIAASKKAMAELNTRLVQLNALTRGMARH